MPTADAARSTVRAKASSAARLGPLHGYHVLGAVQVVSERLGPGVGARLVRARQKIVDQFAAQSQLQLRQVAQVRHFQGEVRGGVLQCEHGVLVGVVPGIDQSQQAEDLTAGADQGDQPVLDPHGAALPGHRLEHLLMACGVRFRIGVGPAGAGPGPQSAEAVLHQHRQSGELVQGPGDGLLAAAGGRELGESRVHGTLVSQLDLHGDHPPLEGCPFPSQSVQLQGVLPPAAVGDGERQGRGGEAYERGEQDVLGLGGPGARRHHEVAVQSIGSAQGQGPAPGHAGNGHEAVPPCQLSHRPVDG